MNEQEKVSVRRVTKDDYSKVMDMFPPGEIYNGRDYLPDYFNMLIDMPNVEAYAGAIGDQFVSFVLYSVVDDGKSVISRALRTRKQYEGRGFSNTLFKCFLETSIKRDSLECEIKTNVSQTKAILKKLEKGQRHQILERHCRNYVGANIKTFKDELEMKVDIEYSAMLINEVEFSELLSNQKLCNKLFPGGRVFVDWVPYKPIESNVVLMKTTRTTIVTSALSELERALLTFFNYYRCPVGLVCTLDIYGQIDSTLKEHLLLHFKNMADDTCASSEKVFLCVCCHEDVNWNFMQDLMKSLGVEELKTTDSVVMCTGQDIE